MFVSVPGQDGPVKTVEMVEAGLHPKPTNTNRLFILDSEKAPTLAGYASADPDQQPISKQNLRGKVTSWALDWAFRCEHRDD